MKKLAVGIVALTSLLPTGPAFADHDYRGDEYEHDYSSNDRNRNRDRDRGAFSPGPFDDSPVDAFNNVCMPGATCYYDGKPGENQPPSAS